VQPELRSVCIGRGGVEVTGGLHEQGNITDILGNKAETSLLRPRNQTDVGGMFAQRAGARGLQPRTLKHETKQKGLGSKTDKNALRSYGHQANTGSALTNPFSLQASRKPSKPVEQTHPHGSKKVPFEASGAILLAGAALKLRCL
jgi:hypothetical protein